MPDISGCNWGQCLLWTLRHFLPYMYLLWSICLMSCKISLSCNGHPLLPALCLGMEKCRNPICLIVNTIFLFFPSLKLCLWMEPMHSINCLVYQSEYDAWRNIWLCTLICPCCITSVRYSEVLRYSRNVHPTWVKFFCKETGEVLGSVRVQDNQVQRVGLE